MNAALENYHSIGAQLRVVSGGRKQSEKYKSIAAFLSRSLEKSSVSISHYVGDKAVLLGQARISEAQGPLIMQSMRRLRSQRDSGFLKADVTVMGRDTIVGFNILPHERSAPAGSLIAVIHTNAGIPHGYRKTLVIALDFLAEEFRNEYFG